MRRRSLAGRLARLELRASAALHEATPIGLAPPDEGAALGVDRAVPMPADVDRGLPDAVAGVRADRDGAEVLVQRPVLDALALEHERALREVGHTMDVEVRRPTGQCGRDEPGDRREVLV